MSTRRLVDPAQKIRELDQRVRDLEARMGRVGSVVTYGSGSNGDYVRFADGTLICWHTFVVSANPTVWTFPQAFGATPNVQATPVTTAHRAATIGTPAANTTTVNVYVTDSAGAHASTTVRVAAFGQEA